MSKESELRNRIAELEGRLEEAEQTLSAIRNGQVDAFVISGSAGQQIYTLTGADHTYRILVEDMREGAVTLTPDGLVLYSNASFANLVRTPLGRVIGSHLADYLTPADGERLLELCRAAGRGEVTIRDAAGGSVPAYVSFNRIAVENAQVLCLVATDLTEQKRAHEILASETLARGILDQAAEAVVVADPSGRIVRASRMAAALAGGDILLHQFEDAFPFTISRPCGAAAGAAHSLIQTACGGATVRGCDAVLTRATGDVAYLLVSAAPLLDSEGQCLGAVATLTDLTAHRTVEEQLRKSEEHRRLAVDAAGIGTWTLDLNSRRFDGCEQCAALLGLGTVRELSVDEFFGLVHPEDRERARAALLKAYTPPATDFYSEFEFRSVRPDGSTHWIAARGRLEFDDSGAPVRLRGIALDIDAAKLMEKELREAGETVNAIVAGAPAAIWLVDAGGRIALWNPAASQLFGYTAEEALAKPGLFHVVAPAALLPLLEAGKVLIGFEAVCAHKDGSRIDISLSTSALRNPDGSYRGFVAIALDITEQKRMEDHLRQTQKLESVGLLAGGVAHDFNNLLTGILGNASLLAETVSGRDRSRVDEIMDASERAASLTRQLLAYAGKGQFVLQTLDLSAVVRDLLPLLRTSLPQKADISLELQDNGLPPVRADRSQLEQVIMNLVINAGEAMGDAAGVITVATRSRSLPPQEAHSRGLKPGLYACLVVTDTGCGMDDATRDRVFEPFFTTKFTGRGLGLAAVHGIVRSSKGTIRVESSMGAGSKFEVMLPAAPLQTATQGTQPDATQAGGSGVVLIVDDEELVRSTAAAALTRYGFKVITAANGQEAVDRFREAPDLIDAVLLDVKMPVMNGRDAMRELRRIRPAVKVLISSGYNETEALRDFSSERVNLFVQKPYRAAALATALRCVIEPDPIPGSSETELA
jgi:two-component system, cell cycle sensor histidine kinase and response regulator CckA